MKQDVGKESSEPLYVLPFDHRFPYACEVFGFAEQMTAEQEAQAAALKQVIYGALEKAIASGLPAKHVAVLVDERFGTPILRDAHDRGLTTILPIERSGAAEFTFEYGKTWREHVERFDPTFVKVLVQLNPAGDKARNARQLELLKQVSDACREDRRRFMFELIVPPEPEQLAAVGGDRNQFDARVRPELMEQAIGQIHAAGITADVWKIEGLESGEDCRRVAQAVRAGGRDSSGCVVLGRGENEPRVRHWLTTAAGTPGFLGFAVGRSIFAAPLVAVRSGKLSAEAAQDQIAEKFCRLVETFDRARRPLAGSGTR